MAERWRQCAENFTRVDAGITGSRPRITEGLTNLSSLHHALPNNPVGLTSSTTAAIR